MKTLSSTGQATIASNYVPAVVLVEMDFSPALYLCASNISVTYNSNTYLGISGVGKISAVQTTPSEIKQLQFELNGVAQDYLSLVLTGTVQGIPCRIMQAIFNPANMTVSDAVVLWAGTLDTMAINDSPNGASIQVTAEHVGIDLNRSALLYYTDSDQQTLHPGDLFFQYTSQQFDQTIIWPAAAYWRK